MKSLASLVRLRRSGAITPEMWEAASRFHDACEGKETWPARAIMALGGFNSPGGSCLWHVLVRGMPIQRWAREVGCCTGMVKENHAVGILISALGSLYTICSMVGGSRSYIALRNEALN